jgi:hypothetical protein
MLSDLVPTLALALALAVAAGPFARAQGQAADPAPREEMIDAIVQYAASGGCKTRRDIFGSAFEASCRQADKPSASDDDERIAMVDRLQRLSDAALIELCRRNGIADCEEPKEVSKGRSVLAYENAFPIEFNSPHAAWSPDARLLLLDNIDPPSGEVRLLDVAGGRLLDPPLSSGVAPRDVAWSPDGRWIALGERKRASQQEAPAESIRLFSVATLTESAGIAAAGTGCEAGLAEGMAFAADSRSLWVPCSWGPSRVANAVQLTVPEFVAERSFVPAFPVTGWSESYWEEGILRFKDDLVAMARFRNPALPPAGRPAVQTFSLGTLQPLHAPVYVSSARLAADLSGLYVGSELWSTASGQRVAADVKASGRCLGDADRLPSLGLYVELRAGSSSRHSRIVVADSASGATVQELGPIPKAIKVLVAPNGARVAVMGFGEIRFYRVNR